ncbi:S8 family serine peptidase [Pseudoalteromonas luteoviolacea]|uniref:Peptidase S8 n=1 Tax=Pseudoalteromonas luteoviolacea H33 TaxID=1365251 RepID=A0A167DW90_9GAMM|nr:S8 family serine peptidase [Pseudoalteromonas luteoviolacea]KZN49453.1 peptidase S8 [Pseudoalteromonas luteoviolacea H33]KZN72614.1 peptidase S8 [Pseudoalteromonas luteoviolacea H33-S]MBQ4876249.1 S8 family serine peptidase [Pseudoalteromonas luteoviolacea]MBQ4906283.1 S8 family serine peptidase [Pseudoalteromonas luteoviolacea]
MRIKKQYLAGLVSALLSVNALATTDRDYEHRWLDPNGDPMLALQWNLLNSGALSNTQSGVDLNLWQTHLWGHKGQDVLVAVIDTGVDLSHGDLSANMVDDPLIDAVPTTPSDHGTMVAGIIAAVQNNIGVRGVAPEAKMVSFNNVGGTFESHAQWKVSHGFDGNPSDNSTADRVRIFNKSYGMNPAVSIPFTFSKTVKDAQGNDVLYFSHPEQEHIYETVSLSTSLDPRTAVYVQGNGNSYRGSRVHYFDENIATFYGYSVPLAGNHGLPWENGNSSYTRANFWNLAVSALSADGVLSSYSTVGSNVFLTAPGGGDRGTPGHATPRISCAFLVENLDANLDCSQREDFTVRMNGTSSSAPNIAGAIALLISAAEQQNHDLTPRDIRHILAQTATKIDPTRADIEVNGMTGLEGWSTNAAGYDFSPYYGFGLADVDKATELVRRFAIENLPSELVKTPWYGLNNTVDAVIHDDATRKTTASIKVEDDLFIEGVQIRLNATHTRISDLKVELESPNGTRSIVMSPFNNLIGQHLNLPVQAEGSSDGYNDHLMLSYKFWNEKANAGNGEWKIHITDMSSDPLNFTLHRNGTSEVVTVENSTQPGTLDSWSIRILGHKNKVTKKKAL